MRTLNMEDRFSHMPGYKSGNTVGFDRKELRDLRRRNRKGQMTQGMRDRLDYLQKVNRGKLAKGAAIAGLTAAAVVAAPAIAGAIGSGASGGGASGLAAALKGAPMKMARGIKKAKSATELLSALSQGTVDPKEDIVVKNGGRLPYKVIKKRK